MKRWLGCAFISLSVACALLYGGFVRALDTDAKASVLIERDSLRVLFSENADVKLPMASTTKIMTAMLAIENGNLDDVVTISETASGIEGSSIWLSPGEHLSLRDLLYGLMLSSGNDAAVAIAEHIGGSLDAFIEMMNARAAELGAVNTNFETPNGLPGENHYTTAYDLAVISAQAMKLPEFVEIVSTQYKRIPWEAGDYDRVLKNKNRLLWQYENANGIKTGYTKEAGKCLVAAAKRDDMQLIAVVLNDGDRWNDSMDLLNFGFENYKLYNILEAGEPLGSVSVREGVLDSFSVASKSGFAYPMTLKESESFVKKVTLAQTADAPVTAGDKLGDIEVYLNDERIYHEDISAPCDIAANTYYYNLERILRLWNWAA